MSRFTKICMPLDLAIGELERTLKTYDALADLFVRAREELATLPICPERRTLDERIVRSLDELATAVDLTRLRIKQLKAASADRA